MSGLFRPRQPQGTENLGAGHTGAVVQDAVHHHRQAHFREQQRQQRRQVGLLARAVVARQHHRQWPPLRRLQRQDLLLHRLIEAQHLLFGFALDAQRDQNAAQLQLGDLPGQHRLIQLKGGLPVQVARMILPRPISLIILV